MPEQKPEKHTKLLLLGFGDINQRLANLKKDCSLITAARRSRVSVAGVNCIAGDVTDKSFLMSLLNDKPDQIVITLSPSDRSEQGYADTYLAAAKALVSSTQELEQAPEVIFISSSSVYAQNSGETVNEKSECTPTRYNGKILIETEQNLLNSSLQATVIRFSGIYGPGRFRLIEKSLDTNRALAEKVHWTNRIHADDCAGVIKHILDIPKHQRQPVYLASDCLPVEQETVLHWLKQTVQCGVSSDSNDPEQAKLQTGKRCDNSLLLNSGYRFTYPSYKEGFIPIIAQYIQQQQKRD